MRFAALLLAAFVALSSSSSAWGFEAHRLIADRMIALLPAELKPLFEKQRAFIVERAFGGVRGYPTSILIDREGIIRHVVIGPLAAASFEPAVRRLLAAGAP